MKKKNEIYAFLGRNTEFDGKLSFSGNVRVDGRFKGEIVGEGTLIIGESATLQADIRVLHLVVSGQVSGNLFAEEKMEILAPGKVVGNIHAPVVVMEEGVLFDGQCHMAGGSEAEPENESHQPG